MRSVVHLTPEEVIEIHRALFRDVEGIPSLRDRGLLESALYRPRSGYYESLFDQAAALFESLVLNHVFLDGNKRIAITAAAVFLKMNGFKLMASADDAEDFVVRRVIRDRISMTEVSEWFRKHSRPLNG